MRLNMLMVQILKQNNFKNTPASLGEGRVKAYGVHYHYDIRDKIAPKGWRFADHTGI